MSCTKDCCVKADCKHCWHFTKQQYHTIGTATLPYKDGGENRKCCHCGKFESDLHGPFAPTYQPAYQSPWGNITTTTAWPVTTPYVIYNNTVPANSTYTFKWNDYNWNTLTNPSSVIKANPLGAEIKNVHLENVEMKLKDGKISIKAGPCKDCGSPKRCDKEVCCDNCCTCKKG